MKKYYHEHENLMQYILIAFWFAACFLIAFFLYKTGLLDAKARVLSQTTVWKACLFNSSLTVLILFTFLKIAGRKRKGGCYGN